MQVIVVDECAWKVVRVGGGVLPVKLSPAPTWSGTIQSVSHPLTSHNIASTYSHLSFSWSKHKSCIAFALKKRWRKRWFFVSNKFPILGSLTFLSSPYLTSPHLLSTPPWAYIFRLSFSNSRPCLLAAKVNGQTTFSFSLSNTHTHTQYINLVTGCLSQALDLSIMWIRKGLSLSLLHTQIINQDTLTRPQVEIKKDQI